MWPFKKSYTSISKSLRKDLNNIKQDIASLKNNLPKITEKEYVSQLEKILGSVQKLGTEVENTRQNFVNDVNKLKIENKNIYDESNMVIASRILKSNFTMNVSKIPRISEMDSYLSVLRKMNKQLKNKEASNKQREINQQRRREELNRAERNRVKNQNSKRENLNRLSRNLNNTGSKINNN